MNNNWWRGTEQMDEKQNEFVFMDKSGKHCLEGPPGSGKTNLLLLRAQYIAGGGEKNVLVLTFTKTLRNFIRSGIGRKGLISPEQIQTYHSWAGKHVMDYLGFRPDTKKAAFDDATRIKLLEQVREANAKLPSKKLYDAIFVDEVQDLTVEELDVLLCLSDKVCICGDTRQGIYQKDGLNIAAKLALKKHSLTKHFRIGHKIANVADKLLPVDEGELSLEGSSNYIAAEMGKATAKMHPLPSRDAQFAKMIELIRVQLDAYNEDTIGIFCGKTDTLTEIRKRFDSTELASEIVVHGVDENPNFVSSARIHAMTIHSSKGTEFRSVHIYGAEELATAGLRRTRLAYTAVTRAKTSLNAYRTGPTTPNLESAFAEPTDVAPADLF